MPNLAPYDAILLLSFGGPDGPADVLPFLANVTRGRGVPPQRLAEVAEHYDAVGGKSPINDLNRRLRSDLAAELAGRGLHLPIAWGNRNWAPYVVDALRELDESGAQRVLVITTSAYSSYSSCRQYREDLAAALMTLATEGRHLEVDRLRAYYDDPGFVAPTVTAVLAALDELPADLRGGARLVFVTHSIPVPMAERSGPDGGAYVAQHRELAAETRRRVDAATGVDHGWELAFCSRSGPPTQPWLEPDVNDHLRELQADGARAVVLVPIGFVSDHMEVVHDLDTEAAQTGRELGLHLSRAATVGSSREFVAGLVDLALERAASARGEAPEATVVGTLGPFPDICVVGCCPNPRALLPAACGADWVGAVNEATLLALAERAARLAGDLVREGRPARVDVTATKTSPTDVVTAMDTASEALLRRAIRSERPDDGILGEEDGLVEGSSGLTWVVDPIDGTVNYLYGIPAYAISVAVVTGDSLDPAGHEVLAGCVHNPISRETWTATAGGGARLDGAPIRVNPDVALDRALVGTGFGYDVARRRHAAGVAAQVLPQIRDIRRIGSAALDLAAVACGRLDAYYERGLGAWDLAAGGLIAREAGAILGGLDGRAASSELVIAAGPALFGPLHDLLRPLRPDRDG